MENPRDLKKITLSLFVATALFSQSGAFAESITIAYLDHGATMNGAPERTDRVTGGWDFVDNDDTPEDTSINRHGTVIANLLLDHAPADAIIMPLKTIQDGENFPIKARGNAAYQYILERPEVRVIDHTHGQAVDIPLMQQAVDTGRVIVIQAGNTGKDYPEFMAQKVPQLKGGGIVVGGILGEDVAFSNKAGNLREYFVVAPVTNRYTSQKGTSFAKPHVSATAATMLARDPHLSPQEVVQIIFDTAEDLGEPGVDDVYGHGKLDPVKALEPVGKSKTGSSSGNGAGIAIAALAVGGAVAYALSRKSESLKKTLILDSYGRSFHLDLTQRISSRDDGAQMLAFTKGYTSLKRTEVTENSPERNAFAVISTPNTREYDDLLRAAPFSDEGERRKDFVYSYYSFDRDGSDYHYALNGRLNGDFGAGRESLAGFNFTSSNVFSTPYLGFSNQGMGISFGNSFADAGIKTRFGLASYDEQGLYGAESDSVLFETQVEQGRGSVGLQVGYLLEDGSLFGGSSNGAFSVDQASTLSLGLSAAYRLNDRLTLLGSYNEGFTSVDDSGKGLLSNFSSLRSSSKSIGLLASSVFQYKDRLGFAIYQPLNISRGSVDLDVPYRRDIAGNVYSKQERLDLSAEGNPETRFELYYGKDLNRRTAVHAHFVHKEGAYLERDGRQSVMAAITHEF